MLTGKIFKLSREVLKTENKLSVLEYGGLRFPVRRRRIDQNLILADKALPEAFSEDDLA